jgi:hypothetical protein
MSAVYCFLLIITGLPNTNPLWFSHVWPIAFKIKLSMPPLKALRRSRAK